MNYRKVPMIVTSIRLPKALHEEAEKVVRELGYRSFNAFVCDALEIKLKDIQRENIDRQFKEYYDSGPEN